ncbi:MAG: hypothetical protein A2Z38_00285 [Planctomycetes bacterium RBG_19FT_COMBO_48_8]|nr:MAG: hypothetical protein A2Z38_00285 [Planctomycetes bacterium RBG_19FT_COMBO_48_8]
MKYKWEIPDQLTIERLGQYFPRPPNEGHTLLDIQGRTASCSDKGMRRRDFLRAGALGATGLTIADWLKMKAHGVVKEARAKSVNTTFDTSNCSGTQRKALFNKLFIGMDFPCFWDPPWKCSFQRKDPQASYAYQVYCMRTVFKQDYDENKMAQNFLNLLPEEFRQ